jgi:molybdopterin/thiamine biosynthesis adenylyltransferase
MSSLIYKPKIFDLSVASERDKLKELIGKNGKLNVLNELNSQIYEFIKLSNPSLVNNKKELKNIYNSFLESTNIEKFGHWVFYPWNNNLIRTLPEDEFIQVRTIRNKYKITQEEQDKLKNKCVGIVGLSVGQSVALAIAMERIAGSIRIADFDHLELGNMNRIRTGLHNIGLPKTIVVAREIAEIDPYIEVECFHEGVTSENIDSFFEYNNQQLDILIDECDSIDVKIALREKARKTKTAVLMDTSDRGMLDIERYDLSPEMELFHGLVTSDDLNRLKHAKTSQDKVDIVGKIINVDTMSEGLMNSMKEIGKTITTWPQLGADVMLGGAITAMMTRKILLNKTKVSGRYFMDLDQMING